jgi:hypothetical protein
LKTAITQAALMVITPVELLRLMMTKSQIVSMSVRLQVLIVAVLWVGITVAQSLTVVGIPQPQMMLLELKKVQLTYPMKLMTLLISTITTSDMMQEYKTVFT